MASLTAGVEIATDPNRVWVALSRQPAVREWFSRESVVDLDAGVFQSWGPNLIGAPPQGAISLAETGEQSIDLNWRFRGADTSVRMAVNSVESSTFVMVEHSELPPRPQEEDAAMHDFWYVALENLRSLVLTGRAPQLPEYTACYGDELELNMDVQADPKTVFACISDPAQLDRYFGRNSVVEPEVGGTFSYGWESGGPVRILEIKPPQKLSVSWQFEGEPDTVVTWSLEGKGGATRITLTHSGFGDDARQDAYRAGWGSFMAIIRSMAELGDQWTMVRIDGVGHGDV